VCPVCEGSGRQARLYRHVVRLPAGVRQQGDAGALRGFRLRRQHFGEQVLQFAGRGLRAQGAGIQLRQQQQAVEHVGQGAHARLQLPDVACLRGQGLAAQALQRQVHRLQRLAQVVADRGQETVLRAHRAVGLVHQPHHVRGQLPALRIVFVVRAMQGRHALRDRREQGRQRMRRVGRWRRPGSQQAGQPPRFARLRAPLQDRGHDRARQPADGDARCQRQLLDRIHERPSKRRFRLGKPICRRDIPSALAGRPPGPATRRLN